jgi:predicted outer membrane protein
VNKIAARKSISKVLAIGISAMAISLWTAGKARADEGTSPAGSPGDGQVVRKVLDLDRSEERTSQAVRPRLGSPQVWNLAERIDVDSTALDRQITSLSGSAPESAGDGVADPVVDLGELSNLSGDALDNAYVDHEVKAHEAMLGAIDNQLLPAVKSDGIRRSLLQLRSEATAHLAQARNVQYAQQVRQMEADERALISREIGNSEP